MARATGDNLYDPRFVRLLFDEMSRTYGVVNLITSLGFTCRWRRQCLRAIHIASGTRVLDLMTGMGELCPELASSVGEKGQVTAVDLSPAMCKLARQRGAAIARQRVVQIVEANALDCPFADNSFDVVVSTFGLKTFSSEQLTRLALEIARVLRPGGQFSVLEISVPDSRLLRMPYMAYIRYLIPMLGWLLLGNPDNYKMLSIYTQAFGSCASVQSAFTDAGLSTKLHSHFFGCATGLSGMKPMAVAGL